MYIPASLISQQAARTMVGAGAAISAAAFVSGMIDAIRNTDTVTAICFAAGIIFAIGLIIIWWQLRPRGIVNWPAYAISTLTTVAALNTIGIFFSTGVDDPIPASVYGNGVITLILIIVRIGLGVKMRKQMKSKGIWQSYVTAGNQIGRLK